MQLSLCMRTYTRVYTYLCAGIANEGASLRRGIEVFERLVRTTAKDELMRHQHTEDDKISARYPTQQERPPVK